MGEETIGRRMAPIRKRKGRPRKEAALERSKPLSRQETRKKATLPAPQTSQRSGASPSTVCPQPLQTQ